MSLETIQNPEVEGGNYRDYKIASGQFFKNETDYSSAIARAGGKKTIDSHTLAQAQIMARVAGITLEDPKEGIDQLVALYEVLAELRANRNLDPKEKDKYNWSKMDSDQRLFAEALRMLGDSESLAKFLAAHPHIFLEGK